MKKIAKYIPIALILIILINAFVSYLNSRKVKNDIDDYVSRRMDAEKAFASMGMTLESFERPISESEVPTRLD